MRIRSIAVAVGAATVLLSANTAFAQTPLDTTVAPTTTVAPDAPTTPETTMVTLFGTGISLSVGTDPAGNLTSVELTDGAGAVAPDAVATEVSPREVKFVIGDNATEVEIEVDGKKITTEVEASALADLVGTHTWSGELFGAGNGVTEITFAISDNGGDPVVELVSATGPGADTAVVTIDVSSNGDETEAKLRVELADASNNQARITVKVEVEQEDDGQIEAELKITVRSDLFATEDSVDPVADPTVNTPIDPTSDDPDSDSDDESDDDSDESDSNQSDDSDESDSNQSDDSDDDSDSDSDDDSDHDRSDDDDDSGDSDSDDDDDSGDSDSDDDDDSDSDDDDD